MAMSWDVVEAKVIEQGKLTVRFFDGLQGVVRFASYPGVFSRLKDPQEFDKLYVKDYFVTWPGELDLAPDAMHEAISKTGECVIQ